MIKWYIYLINKLFLKLKENINKKIQNIFYSCFSLKYKFWKIFEIIK